MEFIVNIKKIHNLHLENLEFIMLHYQHLNVVKINLT